MADIAKINNIAIADISKFNNIAKADITSINDVDVPSSSSTIVTHPTLNTNLIAYWKMEDTSDEKGTYNLSTVGVTSGATGILDNCYAYDGANDYMYRAHNNTLCGAGASNYSVSIWFNADSLSSTTDSVLIGTSDVGNDSWDIRVRSGQLRCFTDTGTRVGSLESYTFNTGTWYHIVLTFNGSTMKTYVNGSELGSESNSGTLVDTNEDLRIGVFGNISFDFDGKIDEVGIWNGKALTSSEVSDLYNSGNALPYD